MIHNESEAAQKQEILSAFKALESNAAWVREIQPKFEEWYLEHLAGCTALAKTPEQRAEHVHAYHMADELMKFVAVRIAALRKEVVDYHKGQHSFEP